MLKPCFKWPVTDEVVYDLGQREQAPSKIADVSIDPQKIFTLFVSAYDPLRRTKTFIRWNEGDADEIAPSLYAGKRRKVVAAEEPTFNGTHEAGSSLRRWCGCCDVKPYGRGLPGSWKRRCLVHWAFTNGRGLCQRAPRFSVNRNQWVFDGRARRGR
jgi:hypothetical protein